MRSNSRYFTCTRQLVQQQRTRHILEIQHVADVTLKQLTRFSVDVSTSPAVEFQHKQVSDQPGLAPRMEDGAVPSVTDCLMYRWSKLYIIMKLLANTKEIQLCIYRTKRCVENRALGYPTY
ncbi:hypothetical protein ILYODFUR_013358 [Ilyodon furcidens]|uniref:Uncharacterized protein n=1 Tax=Ilyodon furcidens TaxID=33524 RepID=A0ABV0SKV5_9TELE